MHLLPPFPPYASRRFHSLIQPSLCFCSQPYPPLSMCTPTVRRPTFLHPQPTCEEGRAVVAGGARGGEGGSRRVAPRWSSTHGDPFLPSGLPWPPPVTFVHPQPTHEAGRSAVVSGPGAPKARGGLLSDASALSPSSDIRGACHMSIVRLHLSCCHRNPSLCPAVYGLRQAAGPSP